VTPYALEREIEDIQALIEAEGGAASLWGWFSVYEVPFMVTPDAKRPTPDYGERLDELVAAGDRNGAVKHFMRNSVGIPAPIVALMRLTPMWKGLRATAHTLPYDWAALGEHTMYGAPLSAEERSSVTVPTLVAYGAKSPAVLREGSRALAAVLPNAELRELEGVSHNVRAGHRERAAVARREQERIHDLERNLVPHPRVPDRVAIQPNRRQGGKPMCRAP
jgi:pimeloyl-ACP methyl ester carboxylesterase